MPRYFKIFIICILFSIPAVPASSELYQYIDENGIMRLTDNPYSVPVDHRAQLEQFTEFEGISDELEILPVQVKTTPPSSPAPDLSDNQLEKKSKTQPEPEKAISPKMPEKPPAMAVVPDAILPPDAEKKITPKAEQKPAAPAQNLVSETTIEKKDSDTPISVRHVSNRIPIKKTTEKSSLQNTAQLKPKKNTKKEIKPAATPIKMPEPRIAVKDQTRKTIAEKPMPLPESKTAIKQKTQPQKNAVVQKYGTLAKTEVAEPEKDLKKSTATGTQTTPVISKKTVTRPQTNTASIPENLSEEKSAAKPDVARTDSSAAAKKEYKTAGIKADQNTDDLIPPQKEMPEKVVKKSVPPDLKESEIQKTTRKTFPEPTPMAKPEPQTANKEAAEIKTAHKTETKTDSQAKKPAPPEIKPADQLSVTNEKSTKPLTDSPVVVKKEIKTKEQFADNKTAVSSQKQAEQYQPSEPQTAQPDKNNIIIPAARQETKIISKDTATILTDQKYMAKPDSETKKPTQSRNSFTDQNIAATTEIPEIKPEIPTTTQPTAPQTDFPQKTSAQVQNTAADVQPALNPAKKDTGPDLKHKTADYKTASNALSATNKTRPETPKLIKNPEPAKDSQIKATVSMRPAAEAHSTEADKQDENVLLAKLESTRKVLANKKKALNDKFSDLMKEKQEIEGSVDEDDEKSVLKYNESVKKLNIKIKQYKRDKKDLQAAIEQYNNAIKQSALN